VVPVVCRDCESRKDQVETSRNRRRRKLLPHPSVAPVSCVGSLFQTPTGAMYEYSSKIGIVSRGFLGFLSAGTVRYCIVFSAHSCQLWSDEFLAEGSLGYSTVTVFDKLGFENKAEMPSLCSIRPFRRTNSIASAFLDEALLGSERTAHYCTHPWLSSWLLLGPKRTGQVS